MTSRKIALGLARQYRTCPPADIRRLSEYQGQVLRHLEICPDCSQGWDDWEELLTGCCRLKESGYVSVEPVAAGQIREIRPEMGRWKDGFYINPPVVLVLDCSQEIASVAQIYHDTTLTGPGDVVLPNLIGFPHNIFVELWNKYDIRLQMLGEYFTRVSSSILEELRQIHSGRQNPSWYVMPRPITKNDPRIFFRSMEQDVGRLFALTVRKTLKERIAEMTAGLKQINVSGIMDIISGASPDFRWPQTPLGDALSFSDDASSSNMALAKLFTFASGELSDVELLTVNILQSEIIDGIQTIGGLIHPIPEGIPESDVFVVLRAADQYIDADTIQLDLRSGAFLAKFRNTSFQHGKTIILILRSLDGCGANA